MYIAPNSTIRLLHSVPLDNTYANTLYFATKTEQANAFSAKTKYTFSAQSYQRVNKGTMRINICADNIYDCNYLMFQNTNFGTKWFYAFITKVEYINNDVSQVDYEIDVMQTWFFDFTFGECFVEREHTATDVIYQNIIDEGLETGEYEYGTAVLSHNFDQMRPCVLSTLNSEGDKISNEETDTSIGRMYDRLSMGGYIYVFNTDNGFRQFIGKVASKGTEDGILACYMIPTAFYTTRSTEGLTEIIPKTDSLSISLQADTNSFDGYTPKNKKLYCYPYNCLTVETGEGEGAIYRYELFKTPSNITFREYCTCTPNPQAISVPVGYKEIADENFSEGVSLTSFPVSGYSSDQYKAWLAQTQATRNTSMAVNALQAIAGGGVVLGSIALAPVTAGMSVAGGVMSGGGMLASGISGIMNTTAQTKDHSILPSTGSGVYKGDVVYMASQKGFKYRSKRITRHYARIIDDFFTMYGYKVNIVKTPSINNRPFYTYVKTQNCLIKGSIPTDDANKICRIFDNGVTHWKGMDNVGNYSLNNQV